MHTVSGKGTVAVHNVSSRLSHKACSQKDWTFIIKLYCLFYIILSTLPFKVVSSTGDTPFPMFLPLLECFLERTFCDGAQFPYHIFLNLLYGLEKTTF